jgi:hypothetical protein
MLKKIRFLKNFEKLSFDNKIKNNIYYYFKKF